MSTDFIPIKKIIETRKGGFIGVCIKESDLSAGTGQNGDWTKKSFTLQDESADLEITCWNDDTKKFHLGGKFEVLGLFWKEYNQQWGANVGKYSQIKQIGNVEIEKETPLEKHVAEEQAKDAEGFQKKPQAWAKRQEVRCRCFKFNDRR